MSEAQWTPEHDAQCDDAIAWHVQREHDRIIAAANQLQARTDTERSRVMLIDQYAQGVIDTCKWLRGFLGEGSSVAAAERPETGGTR